MLYTLALTSNKINNIITTDLLFNIQNISLFIISVSSLFSCIYYNTLNASSDGFNIDKVIIPFDVLMPVVGFHATIDFFITKTYDLKLHHIFVLGIIFYNYYYSVVPSDRFIFLYPLLKTEISSIFYVLKHWIPKNSYIYNINLLLFFCTFFKFRIYDFYYELINNQQHFIESINKYYSKTNYFTYYILLVSCFGLFFLNIYWFLILCKIAYKTITKFVNINTHIICHYLCSYIYYVNIPVSFYIYSNHPHEKNILDIFGVISLSISSYMYHYDIYNRLNTNKITEYINPDKKNIILFFNDNIFINLRGFLIVVTSYYNSPHFINTTIFSSIFHIFSMYHVINNIFYLLSNYNDAKNRFLNIHNTLTGIPIALDSILVFANSSTEIAIPILVVHITMVIIFIVDPFYKLSHFVYHLLLIAQNYYLCLSIVNS